MTRYFKVFIYFFCIFIVSRSYAFTSLDYQIADTSHALASAVRQQNMAVFLLNFSDKPTDEPWTHAQAQDIVFNQVNNLVRELSYNQTYLTGIVIGYYTLPMQSTDPCVPALNTLSLLAINAAQAAGVDLSPYNRHIYMFPFRPNCPFESNSTIGFDSGISKIWINGSSQPIVYLHGLGHNFGLWHSHYSACLTCPVVERGDRADVMGSGPGHFNAFQKERLGWFNSLSNKSPIPMITSSGNYTIGAYEDSNSTVKALKILKQHLINSSSDYYYLELRQPIGLDVNLAACGSSCNFTKGLLIHMGNSNDANSSDLINMGITDSDRLVVLLPGESYIDENTENGGVTITLNSISHSTANLSVIFGTQ